MPEKESQSMLGAVRLHQGIYFFPRERRLLPAVQIRKGEHILLLLTFTLTRIWRAHSARESSQRLHYLSRYLIAVNAIDATIYCN
jgi:hypothetical protein